MTDETMPSVVKQSEEMAKILVTLQDTYNMIVPTNFTFDKRDSQKFENVEVVDQSLAKNILSSCQ